MKFARLCVIMVIVGGILEGNLYVDAASVNPNNESSICENVSSYNVADYNIRNDGTDCTDELQSLIDMVYSSGGGTIEFNIGTYAFSTINLQSNVSLEGQGIGNTTLKRVNGNNTNGAFIYIPTYCVGVSIRDLGIWGDKENDSSETDGIKFADQTDGSFDGDKYDYAKNVSSSVASDVVRTYKHALINNVYVFDFSGNGYYIGRVNYAVTMRDFTAYGNNKCGLYNLSTDNNFDGCYLEENGSHGLYNLGSNNKFVSVKSIWNGKNDHGAWGINNAADRCQFSNIEAQDNWCNGIYISGKDNSFVNVLSDTNGYLYGGAAEAQDCILIKIEGERNRVLGNCAQYNTEYGPIAQYAVVMENCSDCRVDVTIEDGCSTEGSILDETQVYNFY